MGRHYFSKETIFCLSTLLVDRGLSTQGPGFIINNIQPCTIFSPGKAKPAQSSGKGNRWQLWFSISARCGMHLIYGVHLVWYAPFVVCTKCGMCSALCVKLGQHGILWNLWIYILVMVGLYSSLRQMSCVQLLGKFLDSCWPTGQQSIFRCAEQMLHLIYNSEIISVRYWIQTDFCLFFPLHLAMRQAEFSRPSLPHPPSILTELTIPKDQMST